MSISIITVAVAQLNQWVLDFEGNLRRIKESIRIAKEKGAKYRTGPDLELCGYSCDDYIFNSEVLQLCIDAIFDLISDNLTNDILCDIGVPIKYNGLIYNSRVFLLNGSIVLIAEGKAISGCRHPNRKLFDPAYDYPSKATIVLKSSNGRTQETVITKGSVICDRNVLITSDDHLLLMSIDIHYNEEIPKNIIYTNTIPSITTLSEFSDGDSIQFPSSMLTSDSINIHKAIFLRSNFVGSDGSTHTYDGSSFIYFNRNIISRLPQTSFNEVEVIVQSIPVESFIGKDMPIFTSQPLCSYCPTFQHLDFSLISDSMLSIHRSLKVVGSILEECSIQSLKRYYCDQETIINGCSQWLWDYLRRSKANGFVLPLSGGADSSTVALIVYRMCEKLIDLVNQNDTSIIQSLKIILNLEQQHFPTNSKSLCGYLLKTCYLKSSQSSDESRELADTLSKSIGATHYEMNIDDIMHTCLHNTSFLCNGEEISFEAYGGTRKDDLILQNLQGRIRMILTYLISSILTRNKNDTYLVLGTANKDESICGYYTKYDCSSADINPIGDCTKIQLKNVLKWFYTHLNKLDCIMRILNKQPSAELTPAQNGQAQSDENDMGITYEELNTIQKIGVNLMPKSRPLLLEYCMKSNQSSKATECDQIQFEQKKKNINLIFQLYTRNYHKSLCLPPSYRINLRNESILFENHPIILFPFPTAFLNFLNNYELQKTL